MSESSTMEKILKDYSSLKEEHANLQFAFNRLLVALNEKLSLIDAQLSILYDAEPPTLKRPLGEIKTNEYFYNV